MNRQDIILNNNIFIADYYDFDELKIHHYDNFVMLRYFTFINNIAVDKDIYIIEKNVFENYLKDIYNSDKKISEVITFPITETINGFSSSYEDFNPMYSKKSLYKELIIDENNNVITIDKNNNITIIKENIDISNLIYVKDIYYNINNIKTKFSIYLDYGNEVYKLYNINNSIITEANIKCDKIKLYHPISIQNFNGILHIDTYMNNTKFHFLCSKYSNYKTQSESEINKNNKNYSEYIELYVPNISELFNEDNNIYFKEDINIIEEISEESYDIVMDNFIKLEDDKDQYVKLSLFTQPYEIKLYNEASNKIISKDANSNIKQELNLYSKAYKIKKSQIYNNYLSYVINFTLFAISDDIIEENNIYIIDDKLSTNTASFINDYKFSLKASLGFKDGKVSIIGSFNYPMKNKFKTFGEAYKYFNGVKKEDYINFSGTETIEDNMLPEELEEELRVPLTFVGYKLDLYSKLEFKSIFYSKNIPFNNKKLDFNKIDNYAVPLYNIFKNWLEMPDKIYCKLTFMDRLLGINITGNLVVITKEWFKYMINDNVNFRTNEITELNNNFINNFKDMKIINLKDDNNTSNINFINNIRCVVKKEAEEKNSMKISGRNNIKILYKPYFFRTQQLQKISLRENINQNIGINLSEYMTKVESFKLLIDGIEFLETGRNDAYVIFYVLANNITKKSGKYDILTQDDEYISTGTYNIY